MGNCTCRNKLFVSVVILLFALTTICCTRTMSNVKYLNKTVRTYYMKSTLDVSFYEDDYNYTLTLYNNAYTDRQEFIYHRSAGFTEYGYYEEYGDTIITYPKYVVENALMLKNPLTIVTDSSEWTATTSPTLYIKQKDNSLLLSYKRIKTGYWPLSKIEYNGNVYSLTPDLILNWDYKQYPKEVQDSIDKMTEDAFEGPYIPLKYAEY